MEEVVAFKALLSPSSLEPDRGVVPLNDEDDDDDVEDELDFVR